MMFLAVWGLFFMWKQPRFKAMISALIWYMPFNIFIVLSWYGWWYGGCFGLRAFIPALAIMAFPLAVLFDQAIKGKWLVYTMAGFFIFLNIFQSFQYQRQILHMDSMTWRAYFYIFGKVSLNEEEKAKLKTMLDYADYSERGKKLDEYFK